jgi:hypothetical protein
MKYTTQAIGKIVRENRKRLGVTQKDLTLTSGTGCALSSTSKKETCQIGKVLTVLQTRFSRRHPLGSVQAESL